MKGLVRHDKIEFPFRSEIFIAEWFPSGAGGIISSILHKQISKTYSSDKNEEVEIGFARKKVPEQSEHILDVSLGTLLNGYVFT